MNSSVHTLNLRSIEACCNGTISFRPNVQRHICFTPRNATALCRAAMLLMPLFRRFKNRIDSEENQWSPSNRTYCPSAHFIQIFIVIIKELKSYSQGRHNEKRASRKMLPERNQSRNLSVVVLNRYCLTLIIYMMNAEIWATFHRKR